MNNGNAVRQSDDMPQAENPSAKQWQQHEGDIARRDRAIAQGDELAAVETTRRVPTITGVGERAILETPRREDTDIVIDGLVFRGPNALDEALDYKRGL